MKNGHLKYSLGPELINSLIASGTRFVTGQYVAHAKRTIVERAYEAADLHTGKSLLVQPTVVHSARLWNVNASYVHRALKRPNDRLLVESGAVPLVPLPGTRCQRLPFLPTSNWLKSHTALVRSAGWRPDRRLGCSV